MPKVICTRENASDLINGVKFEPHEKGVISEEISDEQAANFLRIPGYELDGAPSSKPAGKADDDEAEIEALRKRAEELGIQVNTRWKQDRLSAEIEKAEDAAKAAAAANSETNAD